MWYVNDAIRNAIAEGATQVLYKLCDMWINKSMRAVYTDIIVLYKLCDMWITKPETQQSME